MSDLLYNVSLARKSLQKKRQLRSKDLSLNFLSIFPLESDRSKTERSSRLRSQEKSLNSEILVTSPVPPRRFEFQQSISSPLRIRSYKLDAVRLLVSRVSRFLNKHFLIWKRKSEYLRGQEADLFIKQAKRLKVSVGKVDKNREILHPETLAGKIVRKSQDIPAKFISNVPSSLIGLSDDDTPLIESGHEARTQNLSRREHEVVYTDEAKIIEKFVPSPRYSYDQVVENGIGKLVALINALALKNLRAGLNTLKIRSRLGKIKTRLAMIDKEKEVFGPFPPEETSSPSIFGDSDRSDNKQVFQGCLKNLRDFIQDKREKKGKTVTRVNLEVVEKAFDKLAKVMVRVLGQELFSIYKESKRVLHSAEELAAVLRKLKNRATKLVFEKISGFSNKTFEKTMKNLVKNLNQDIKYRISISFRHWKTSVKSLIKHLEEFSLSAVSIHNILLHLINLRTKIFFSTYKLAMIKFIEQNQEKFKNYSKAVNRLSLCLREYKLKPFITWKYSVSSMKSRSQENKKNLGRLERALRELLFENFQFSFLAILYSAKKKTVKIRALNRVLLKTCRNVFRDFRMQVMKSMFVKDRYYGTATSFALNMKDFGGYMMRSPKKFSFKYLCHCMGRLGQNLSFHYNSVKKNTVTKWKLGVSYEKQLKFIRQKYDREINHAIAAGKVFNKMSLVFLNVIRLSFMKLRKAENKS